MLIPSISFSGGRDLSLRPGTVRLTLSGVGNPWSGDLLRNSTIGDAPESTPFASPIVVSPGAGPSKRGPVGGPQSGNLGAPLLVP